MSDPSCVLCTGAGGRLLWRNESLRVIAVDDPDLPGYTRVVWHEHVAEMTDLGVRERLELLQATLLVESVQRQILCVDKVNLASLGNYTPHLHWHVIPRWRDDPWFPDSHWAARRALTPEQNAAWAARTDALRELTPAYEAALTATLEHL